jgi:hypothetical protein
MARIAAILGGAGVAAGCSTILGDFRPLDTGTGPDAGTDGSPAEASVADTSEGGLRDATVADAQTDGARETGRDGETGVDSSLADSADAPGGDAGSEAARGDATDAGFWSPTVLDQAGELALWLEASATNLVISSGAVGTWKDLSQNKNDATNAQAGPLAQAAIVNGHDAVRFNTYGVGLSIADAPSLQLASDQIYLVAVARSTYSSGYFFSKVTNAGSGAGVYYVSGLEFFMTGGTDDAGATILFPSAHIDSQSGNSIAWGDSVFDDGKFHIVALRRINSSMLAIAVDDQAARTAPVGAFSLSEAGKGAAVGSVAYGNFRPAVDFSIAELVLVHDARSGVIADADVASLHAYLKQKYGI